MLIFHVRTGAGGYLCGIETPKHTIGREWAAGSLEDPCLCSECAAVLKQELHRSAPLNSSERLDASRLVPLSI
jgi:hypothetical protein